MNAPRSGSPAAAKKRAEEVLHFLHNHLHNCGQTVQFTQASPGSDVILNKFISPGAATVLPSTVMFTYP